MILLADSEGPDQTGSSLLLNMPEDTFRYGVIIIGLVHLMYDFVEKEE